MQKQLTQYQNNNYKEVCIGIYYRTKLKQKQYSKILNFITWYYWRKILRTI